MSLWRHAKSIESIRMLKGTKCRPHRSKRQRRDLKAKRPPNHCIRRKNARSAGYRRKTKDRYQVTGIRKCIAKFASARMTMLVGPIAMLQVDRINSFSQRCSKARSADLTPQSEATPKWHRRPTSPFIYRLSSIVFRLSSFVYRLNASQSARQSAAKSAAAVEGSS